jgi:uncharacterized protein YdeI (YjbR/CyaY-like superfamily)
VSNELPIKLFASQSAWEKWLEENHARSTGAWLKIAKLDGGVASVTYPQAVEVALCFGWIDGQKDKLDARFWLQKFTPRAARSRWSKINREKVTLLIEQGRMRPSGLKAVELAKSDGRWAAAYDPPSRLQVPPDFARALKAQPAARAFFDELDRTNRYAMLYRVHDAKKPETRARRIATFVEMCKKGERLHPK